jgi:short-chain fatty acids transporter
MTVLEETGRAADGAMARVALRFTAFAERWFPDAFVFVVIAVLIVAAAALANGASPDAVVKAFGEGLWSLLTFAMQMALMVVLGYVVATSPPFARFIEGLAELPSSGRRAIALIAAMTMLVSLVSWAMSMIFGGLLARACARRTELAMDYRAAGAAGNLGIGAIWALGISSSAAQLQANPASLPKSILDISGVIPLTETIFLWQSAAIAAVIFLMSYAIAYWSAPAPENAVTAEMMGVDVSRHTSPVGRPQKPGEWLEHWPVLSLALAGLGAYWLVRELERAGIITLLSSLNTLNLIFLVAGLLLHWRPRSFLAAVSRSVPATAGIIIQFPLYGSIAAILTSAKNAAGVSVSDQLAEAFVSLTTQGTFPIAMGIYSAILGLFVPSGGGKWLLEAPYVIKAAIDLEVHLGWTVQIYNASEALPNLVNPFYMLPLLGVLGLKARDIVGFTFLQLVLHTPVVLFLLWALAPTLTFTPPVFP